MTENHSPAQKTVLSNHAYRSVRSAILTGKIPFGTQLVVRELSEVLELSPTPIKSALTTLESEGLVIAIPYRGFFVPSFDASDVLEIYSIREALERKAARLTAIHANKNSLNKLNHILTQQIQAAKEGNTEQHIELDLSFHRTIAEATRNQRLIDISQSVLGQAHLIVASAALSVGRYPDIEKEHQAILNAIQSKDANAAETAAWQHNQNASLSLINHYHKQNPEALDFKNNQLLTTETILSKLEQDKQRESVDTLLSELQQNQITELLAEYVGPMAIFILRDALSKARNLKELTAFISNKIPKPQDTRAFKQELSQLLPKLQPDD